MANKIGLVSVSFRSHTPKEILQACVDCKLDGIEWGGDVHVPHGDTDIAARIAQKTKDFHLETIEYGSYYILGQSDGELFDRTLASAKTLETGIIRVWPGKGIPSEDYDKDLYDKTVSDAKRICALAPDMILALECHPNTLTDDYHSILRFLEDVGCDNLKMFWQVNQLRSVRYNIEAARALQPFIISVHVFHWIGKSRFPLALGHEDWKQYLDILMQKDLNYMLEFMPDNQIETLGEEANTLREWVKCQ